MRLISKIKSNLASNSKQRAFTIVELVVVIAVMSIIAGMSVAFIQLPVRGYVSSEINYALADEADNALRRMARDVRDALPNSVRTTVNGTSTFLEFIPVHEAGRYRAEHGASGIGNPLAFGFAGNGGDSFDVLGAPINVVAGEQLVIYNMGIAGADAYAGNNVRAMSTSGSLSTITFTGAAMPLASPSNRFYTIGGAVSYVCDTASKQLLRYGEYALSAAQRTSFSGITPRVIASNLSDCSFSYTEGILQRSGLVLVSLALSKNNANVRLINQINILNSP